MKRPFIVKTLSLVTLASCLFALDQWCKQAATALKGHPSQHFLGGLVRWLYAENRGAWGNLGEAWPSPFRSLFLTFLPTALLIGLFIYILFSPTVKRGEFIGLSLIFSGGLGNLVDRIRYDFVVDMFWIGLPGTIWQTNIFNVADAVIMTGLGFLLAVHGRSWLQRKFPRQRS